MDLDDKNDNTKHHIVCINSGSSSMKFAVYDLGESEKLIVEGAVERIGLPGDGSG
ncbi:MAG: hypothetical protein ACP5IL_16855 [Syntrophobacteraceae bacterium]